MIGKEILNYRIISLLGRGGMGSVYLAEHTLIKNEKVAIKVINANMANSFTREQLQHEAEHLAALNHNNIVSFKNYQVDEEGNLYLIMEYADGMNLGDYIKYVSGLIVEERICPIFEPILDAVGYAHKRKRLHRDIKPANIVITDEGVKTRILDFPATSFVHDNDDDISIYAAPWQSKSDIPSILIEEIENSFEGDYTQLPYKFVIETPPYFFERSFPFKQVEFGGAVIMDGPYTKDENGDLKSTAIEWYDY